MAEHRGPEFRRVKRKDGAELEAERLFSLVRANKPEHEVIAQIATALRKAAQGPRRWGVMR